MLLSLENESYVKNKRLDVIKEYIEQSSFYISKKKNINISEAKELVIKAIKESNTFKDPHVVHYYREDNGDKGKKITSLTKLFNTINNEKLITAPSLTSHLPITKNKSPIVGFISKNVNDRSKEKHKSFLYRAKGDMEKSIHHANMSAGKKIYNNSLSGLYASRGNPLYNFSCHYTLTSTTRTVTSISNVQSEQMIAGNRNYRTPELTLNHIITLSTYTDNTTIRNIINKYNLYIPTPEEIVDNIILPSTSLYWDDEYYISYIFDFLSTLTDEELCNVSYSNDLYHLRTFNNDLMYNFITLLSTKKTRYGSTVEDMNSIDGDIRNLSHHICMEHIEDRGTVYEDMVCDGTLDILYGTCLNIIKVMEEYKDILHTFFVTDILPLDIANVSEMVRKAVVLSDTDSTCATYQDWVDWYMGDILVTPKAVSVSASIMYLTTSSVSHLLKVFSGNIGITTKYIPTLAMKNEYFWTSMGIANANKHYNGATKIQEGNVFKVPDLELKGAHFLAGGKHKPIRDKSKEILLYINNSIAGNNKISILKIIEDILAIEDSIRVSILKGEVTYLPTGNIKTPSSYKLDKSKSPYFHHTLYNSTFGHEYGMVEEPPYVSVKINTTLSSKKLLTDWLNSLSNVRLAKSINTVLETHNKTALNTIHIAYNKAVTGLPEELIPIINIDKVILDTCKSFYLSLETLGFILKPNTTLTQTFM